MNKECSEKAIRFTMKQYRLGLIMWMLFFSMGTVTIYGAGPVDPTRSPAETPRWIVKLNAAKNGPESFCSCGDLQIETLLCGFVF